MTVHSQRIDVRRPILVATWRRLLAWVAIAAIIALVGIALLTLLEVIGPVTQATPLIERLQDLRTTIGGGGFI